MKNLFIIIVFILSMTTYSQNKISYIVNGQTIEFTVSSETMIGLFNPNSEPTLVYKDGTKEIPNCQIIIKIKPNNSLSKILTGTTFTSEVYQYNENTYLIQTNLNASALFTLVTNLNNDNRVVYSEPNFMKGLKRLSASETVIDTYLASQWAINNQGYLGGTVDADMDVDDAWNIVTGTGIKVAVIDEGVDLNHSDLRANLLAGYDATDRNLAGAPINNEAHGTACAGIIAAVNNNIGIRGVAYNSKIIPVRIAYNHIINGQPMWTNNFWISKGIDWAWKNGADILSNSWGGGSFSLMVKNAINDAVIRGRNGKGCIFLVSSGNDNGGNGNPVSFPANLPNTIAVGAISMCNQRKNLSSCDGENWGSNYGNKLDIVAPGVKIYATDISGSKGYNSTDYRSDFNGTSSACPNVAGVAALVLSANPNLTGQQVRDILESTAQKVGGYSYATTTGRANGTWNNEMGYGLVNAHKAVLKALPTLTGSSTIYNTSTATYTLKNAPPTATVTWSVSSNLKIISSTNTNVRIRHKSGTNTGNASVSATINNGKKVTVKNDDFT